ncbi:HU family DNA-binding protein [Patescibacteria group bacterium]|nr:HU family DNA-binding protein [Patescibacteria group bacterium]MBU4141940.1 HU family DNA-binding protein [Patescibacteria group bacterium]MBU4338312.1 HU family DNA-binding protein [Patescibacteria group bacterium]
MTKDELVDAVANKTNLSKKDTELTINTAIETITKTLQEGGKVVLTGFGIFSVNQREARMGVNPQKPGVKIQIPAMKVPKFKAGKTLKEAVR